MWRWRSPAVIHRLHRSPMRTIFLIAFGFHIVLGTSCRVQTASAQDTLPEIMMSVALASAPASHAGCAPHDQEAPAPATGDVPCLGHCLSQATQRSSDLSPLEIPSSPTATPPASCSACFAGNDLILPIAEHPPLSPPSISMVVLRQ